MAKRIKKETAVVAAVLAALAVGGAVGIIGSASNGFDKDILDEWVQVKEDYVKIDLSNAQDGKALTTDSALVFLNTDNKVFDQVDLATNVSLENNGLVIGDDGALQVQFDNDGYNRVKITASANYSITYETNSKGEEKTDIFGNKIVESIDSSDCEFSFGNGDSYTVEAGEDDKYPVVSSFTMKEDEQQSALLIETTFGELLITSIELWNVDLDD